MSSPNGSEPHNSTLTSAEAAPAAAGADAATAERQPITPDETQGTPVRGGGTSASAEVPVGSQALAVSLSVAPLPAAETLTFLGVKPDINEMTRPRKYERDPKSLMPVDSIRVTAI